MNHQRKLGRCRVCILAIWLAEYLIRGWPLVTRPLKGARGIVVDVRARLKRVRKAEGINLWRL